MAENSAKEQKLPSSGKKPGRVRSGLRNQRIIQLLKQQIKDIDVECSNLRHQQKGLEAALNIAEGIDV